MITKNILYKYFKDFADNHLQIKDYGYGDLSEISSSTATTYPLFWVSPQPSNISGNEITYNFNILIGDRLEDGDANKVEVESDTFQIGLDLLATLNLNRDVDLDKSNTLTPFIHDFKDRIAGHLITVSVTADFDYNECAVPTTGTPTPPISTCPVAIITINGVSYGSVGSGNTEDIAVVDGSGTPVGSLVSGNWVVSSSCPNATAVLKDSAGTTISTTSIASGASSNITAPDGSAVLKNTLNTTLSTTSILSNGSANITAPDSTAVIKDDSGNILKTSVIPSNVSQDVTINDSTAVLKNTLATTLSTTSINAESSANITAPDSTITINSAAFSPYPSGATSNILVKDGSGNQVGSKVGTEWIVPSGSAASGVLFKTIEPSQYTSYRTGDEGWRVQNGWFDYTPPTTPKSIAELDFTSANFFSVLKNPLVVNGVSSTTRFVDINGIQAFSATGNANLATIDKLTGLMYYRINPAATNWNTSIDNSLAFSFILNGITYSDWYVATNKEILNTVHNYAGISVLNDPATGVLLWPNNFNYWSSTTYADATTFAWFYGNLTRGVAGLVKTDLRNSYYVTNVRNLITAP
jgi:hypothetical protein